MTPNEGGWDRAIRILAGIALVYAAWMAWFGAAAAVFSVIAAIAIVTGIGGWCPGYAFFHVSTKHSSA